MRSAMGLDTLGAEQAARRSGIRPRKVLLSGLGVMVGLILLAILPATSVAAECTNTWTGPAEGSWTTAANWSAGQVPTEEEVACIGSGKTVNVSSGTNQVGVVQGEGTLTISGSTLEVRNVSEVSTIKALTMKSSGVLSGPGTLRISGTFSWANESTMSGSGSTVLLSGATGSMTLTASGKLKQRRFVNEGTFTQTSGRFAMSEGAEVSNAGTLTTKSTSATIVEKGTGSTAFVNTGTFQKTSGTGTVGISVPFENKGTVDAQIGKLSFTGGGSSTGSGKWEAAKSAGIGFAGGSFSLAGTIAGPIAMTGGSTTVANESLSGSSATLELESLSFSIPSGGLSLAGLTMKSSSTLTGPGILNISETFSWANESTMSGSGSTVLLSGATGSMTLTASGKLKQRRFVNEGAFTQTSGRFALSEGAEVSNTGTFTTKSTSSPIVEKVSGSTAFVNTGTFQKTSGTGTAQIGVPFENNGVVHAQTGKLSFAAGGSSNSSGKWEAASGAGLSFVSGSFTLSGTLSGAAAMTGSSTTITIESLNMSAASLEIETVSLSIPSGTSNLTSLTMKSSSTLTGPGTLNISETFSWANESTMSGSGSTVLASGATASTTLTANGYLKGRSFVNEGTFTNGSSGTISLSEGAEFLNTGTFNANTTDPISVTGGGSSTFVNTGTLRRTSGSEAASISLPIENNGTVNSQVGELSFAGGGVSNTSAKWEAAEGAQTEFAAGTFLLRGTLAGPIAMTGGTVAIEALNGSAAKLELHIPLSIPSGATSLTALTMKSGANLTGPGTLTISETFSWANESTMSGLGTTVLSSGATASMALTAQGYIKGRRFINEGTYTNGGSGTVSLSEGAEFVNTGTFNANTEDPIAVTGDLLSAFVNTGTFRKTIGTNSVSVATPFENKGTVDAQTGQLSFTAGGASTAAGIWKGSGTGEVNFDSGAYFLSASSLSGAIRVSSSASLFASGINGTGASLILDGGSFEVPSGSVTVDVLTMISSGEVEGAGNLSVSSKLNWTKESTMRDSGSTTLLPGATATTTMSANARIKQRRFINEGTFTMSTGTVALSEGAEFVNKGTFDANTVETVAVSGNSGSGGILNTGTFQKTSGSGTTEVKPDFVNNGTIRETSGKLKIASPKTVLTTERFGKRSNCGDPVECATGDFYESQTDIAIGGRGLGLLLTRSYSAQAAASASSAGSFGYGWRGPFSDRLAVEGEKVTWVQANGNTVPFTEAGEASYNAPAWSQDRLVGSPEAGFVLTRSDQVQLGFSGSGRLEGLADRNGNETTLGYDEANRLETIADPAGRQITFAYNGGGQVESAEDPMGNLVEYAYEGGHLVSVTLAGEEAPRWQFEYDGSHRITKMVDGRGGETVNEYDGSNRVISQTDPAGHTLSFEYASFHTTITNESTGAVTDQWFTSNNQPYSITRGFGTANATTETFGYNAAGQLVATTDGNGHTTTYVYDAQGDLRSEKNAEGNETKWAYNGTHDVISMTTPDGETTTMERDADGNIESISRPGPEETIQTTIFVNDEFGQLESVTDPLERTWTYSYSEEGDRISETDPEGNTRTSEYDQNSRLEAIVSPRGNAEGAEAAEYTTTIERDPQGRPLKVIDPLGHATEYAYDANGNLEEKTNANGHTTKYAYNANNQQIKIEKPNGAILETSYDGAGNVTSQTDGNEETTTYVRNVLGQSVEVIDPLNRKTIEEFDDAGNLKAMIDPAERKTSYAYDKADRLIGVDYSSEATPDVGLEYDANGNVTSMVDGTGESTFVYDELGRLTGSENGNGDVVGYGYNLGDQLTGILYPNGKSISRTFDEAGRLETVTDWLGGTTSFDYDADSNLEEITFPVGTGNVDEYEYDPTGRMSAAKFMDGPETLASLSYVRDKIGQVEDEASNGLPGAEEIAYGYDENERLIEAGEASLEYDAADNLTKAPGTTNAYDAASQLETGTAVSYTYDKLGQRIETAPGGGPATSYDYDQAGNLISIERPEEGEVSAIAQSLSYDGTGLLTSKSVGMSTQHFTWDSSGELPLLLDDDQNSYIYGPNGLPIAQIQEEEATYIHHDQLGTTRVLTDSSGEVVGRFSFGAYGTPEGSTGTATTPMGFAGQYTDAESGLQYLRARFYDPATGQFITKDPLAAILRTPYGYANQSPLHYVDPSGMSCVGVGHAGPVSYPTFDPVDCATEAITGAPGAAADVGGLVLDLGSSAVLPVLLSIACIAEPDWCPALFAGGVGATVGSNAAKEAIDPCFNVVSEMLNDLLVAAAAALPGGVFGVTAGRSGPQLGPIARRIIQIVLDAPGLALEIVRSTGR
jgi:RHS repeat-associated protein